MKIVAIDESGDPGNKIDSGSSKFFSLALVSFDTPSDLEHVEILLNDLSIKLFNHPDHEFHFSHEKFKYRKMFFEVVSVGNFTVNVFLVDRLKYKEVKDFYSFIYASIFKNQKLLLRDSFLKIDGGNSKKYEKTETQKIKRIAKENDFKINKIKFYDSKNNRDIQIADFFAGAVRRYVEDCDPNDIELFSIFKTKVTVIKM